MVAMKTLTGIAAAATAVVIGGLGATAAYQSASSPTRLDSEHTAPVLPRSATDEAPATPAATPAPPAERIVVRLRPCRPPSKREGKRCVTTVEHRVTAAPAPQAVEVPQQEVTPVPAPTAPRSETSGHQGRGKDARGHDRPRRPAPSTTDSRDHGDDSDHADDGADHGDDHGDIPEPEDD